MGERKREVTERKEAQRQEGGKRGNLRKEEKGKVWM